MSLTVLLIVLISWFITSVVAALLFGALCRGGSVERDEEPEDSHRPEYQESA